MRKVGVPIWALSGLVFLSVAGIPTVLLGVIFWRNILKEGL